MWFSGILGELQRLQKWGKFKSAMLLIKRYTQISQLAAALRFGLLAALVALFLYSIGLKQWLGALLPFLKFEWAKPLSLPTWSFQTHMDQSKYSMNPSAYRMWLQKDTYRHTSTCHLKSPQKASHSLPLPKQTAPPPLRLVIGLFCLGFASEVGVIGEVGLFRRKRTCCESLIITGWCQVIHFLKAKPFWERRQSQ